MEMGILFFLCFLAVVVFVVWVKDREKREGKIDLSLDLPRISFKSLFRWDGKVDRGSYALVGLVGFALKYNMDRCIAYFGYGKSWSLFEYVSPSSRYFLSDLTSNGELLLVLLTAALPFIWVGVAMTLKRLRSTGLPLPLVFLFFVPVLNLVFFIILAILPEAKPKGERTGRPRGKLEHWLDRCIPRDSVGNAALAAGFSAFVSGIFVFLTVNLFQSYGLTVFVAVPFGMGLLSALLYGYHEPRSLVQSLSVACLSTLILGGLLLALAFEGIICLLMAMPIGLALALLGGLVGYLIQKRPERPTAGLLGTLLLFFPLMMGMETTSPMIAPVFEVKTSVDIQAPPEKVWRNVVAFAEIPPPTELFFKLGIAYPIRAKIEGKGPGAVRHCVFSTGPFVEPIQVWDEPRLLKFSVTDNPAPMAEWTPYHKIHPPHLKNFLVSNGGQFLLIPLPGGGTRLEGTTWYLHHMWPTSYWQIWSDGLIHQIHLRVLNHIKNLSEAKS